MGRQLLPGDDDDDGRRRCPESEYTGPKRVTACVRVHPVGTVQCVPRRTATRPIPAPNNWSPVHHRRRRRRRRRDILAAYKITAYGRRKRRDNVRSMHATVAADTEQVLRPRTVRVGIVKSL